MNLQNIEKNIVKKFDGCTIVIYPFINKMDNYGNCLINKEKYYQVFNKIKLDKSYNYTNLKRSLYIFRDTEMKIESDSKTIYANTQLHSSSDTNLIIISQISKLNETNIPVINKYHDESHNDIHKFESKYISIEFTDNGIYNILVTFIIDMKNNKNIYSDLEKFNLILNN
jgi:hypothetical protein